MFILGGIAAAVALCIGGAVVGVVASGGGQENSAAPVQPAAETIPATTTPSAATTTEAAPAEPPSTSAAPTRVTKTPSRATKTPVAVSVKVPNGVGMDYQSAQDLWRSAGLIVAPAIDATGANRLPVIDANWVVLKQNLKAGSKVSEGVVITATVKKYTDD